MSPHEGRPERLWDALVGAHAEAPTPRERYLLQGRIQELAPRLPWGAWSRERRDQAHGFGVTPTAGPPRGVCAFPAINGVDDRFVEVRVRLHPHRDHSDDLEPIAAGAVRDAFAAARRYLCSRQTFALSVETPDFQGGSLGLAVALAAVSAATGEALRPGIVATGRGRPDGRVELVGGCAEKLSLLGEARGKATLLAPAAWTTASFCAHLVSDLDEAVKASGVPRTDKLWARLEGTRASHARGQWREAARSARALMALPALDTEERYELATVLLMAANHLGDTEGASEWAQSLEDLKGARVDDRWQAQALCSMLVAAVDRFDLPGVRALSERLRLLSWSRTARVHVSGTLALGALALGDLDAAIRLRSENLEQAPPAEVPRCLGDLAEALRRGGRVDEAVRTAETAVARLETTRMAPALLRTTRTYALLHAARARRALGDLERAVAWLLAVPEQAPDSPLAWLVELERELATAAGPPATAAPELLVLRRIWLRERALRGVDEALAELQALPECAGLSAEALAARIPY